MGLRSWLTPLEGPGDWDFFRSSLDINPDGIGVNYVIDITVLFPGLSKGLWVAWSGDGSGSKEYLPHCFWTRTVLLDNLIEECPGFTNPLSYGRMIDPGEVEDLLSKRHRERPCPEGVKPENWEWMKMLESL